MKNFIKWGLIIFVLLIVVSIFASGGDDSPKVVDNNTSLEKSSEESSTVFKVGESIDVGKAVITVNNFEFSSGGDFIKPTEGNKYLNVNLTIQNKDSSDKYVTTLGQMFIKDGEGNSYQVASTDKSVENINNNLDGNIIADSKRTGWVGFEVKDGVENLQFVYNDSLWFDKKILVDLK
jgi:hypothetical protein